MGKIGTECATGETGGWSEEVVPEVERSGHISDACGGGTQGLVMLSEGEDEKNNQK